MTAATIARPSLRAVILDALNEAYWLNRNAVEGCAACTKSPAGVCPDRDCQDANRLAREYDEARKQLERNPGHPDVLAVYCGIEGGES